MEGEGRSTAASDFGVAELGTFTDSHAHLEMVAERLGETAAREVLAAYAAAFAALSGASGIHPPLLLDPGVEADDLGRRVGLARRLLSEAGSHSAPGSSPPWLRFAAGIWPGRPALDDPAASVSLLRNCIAAAEDEGVEVAAIGECGLDFHHMEADEGTQRRLFGHQRDLAAELGLPLVVHTRDAAGATVDELADAPSRIPVLIHCYGYGPDELPSFLDAGCYVSFAGNLTYKKSEGLREALGLVPEDRLLLETDAPYMNPDPRRGKPSSPLDVGRSYERAAEIRGVEVARLREIVAANAWNLFGARRR